MDQSFADIRTDLVSHFHRIPLIDCTALHVESHIRIVPPVPGCAFHVHKVLFELSRLHSCHQCLSFIFRTRLENVVSQDILRNIPMISVISIHVVTRCGLILHHYVMCCLGNPL